VPLRFAAAALLAEAAGLLVATAFAAVATADGKSYQAGAAITLTGFVFIMALAVAALAVAAVRARPWSRVPVLMIQAFVIIAGITLMQGHRLAWGIPAFILAVAVAGGMLAPASLKALRRSEA